MTDPCPHCDGTGLARVADPAAALRSWCERNGVPVDVLGRVCAADAADIVGVDVDSLRNDRVNAVPKIPFIRIGGRRIRYDLRDLADYLQGERVE